MANVIEREREEHLLQIALASCGELRQLGVIPNMSDTGEGSPARPSTAFTVLMDDFLASLAAAKRSPHTLTHAS